MTGQPRHFLDVFNDPDSESDRGEEVEEFNFDALPLHDNHSSPNGPVHPLESHSTSTGSHLDTDVQLELRDRSPLHSTCSPGSSPDILMLSQGYVMEFCEGPSTEDVSYGHSTEDVSQNSGRACRVSRRGKDREGVSSRDVSRRGRARRTATKAANVGSVLRQDNQVLEVCLDDEDVPPHLRDMVFELESARRAKRMQGVTDSGPNVRKEDSEDEIQDVNNFVAQELFGGDSGAMEFEWASMASFRGRSEVFQPENTGPTAPVTSAYEAFRTYWDDDILQLIVRETNRYAVEVSSSSASFAKEWYDTNEHEILTLFAFWMMIGIIKMPSIKSCFSNNPLLKTGIFKTLISESRYWNLNRALHFVDNSTRTLNSSKLFCLGPLVEYMNDKFQKAYTLDQNITIGESLTLWKGNQLPFKQSVKTKAARFGIKTFELCESATGYLWSFVIYTGKDDASFSSRLPKSTEIVVKLMQPLLNKGHKLFLDNWFNSPLLARFLKRNRTDCVGTLRKSSKNMPALVQLTKLAEGTCVARHSGDVVVMAYQNKKTTYTISTCHGTESVQIRSKPGRVSQCKPAVIADYNRSMGGIDRKDQMLEPYLLERKRNQKWYKKMFKRILNVSIFNSHILVDRSSGGDVKQLAFRLELVDAIVTKHLPHVPKLRRRQPSRTSTLPPQRFSGNQHFICRAQVNGTKTMGTSRYSLGRALCIWCSKHGLTKKTVYMCKICDVRLCLEGCFEKFHTPS